MTACAIRTGYRPANFGKCLPANPGVLQCRLLRSQSKSLRAAPGDQGRRSETRHRCARRGKRRASHRAACLQGTRLVLKHGAPSEGDAGRLLGDPGCGLSANGPRCRLVLAPLSAADSRGGGAPAPLAGRSFLPRPAAVEGALARESAGTSLGTLPVGASAGAVLRCPPETLAKFSRPAGCGAGLPWTAPLPRPPGTTLVPAESTAPGLRGGTGACAGAPEPAGAFVGAYYGDPASGASAEVPGSTPEPSCLVPGSRSAFCRRRRAPDFFFPFPGAT